MADRRERVARAMWNTGFHPDDVASGEAERRITEWPHDWAKSLRQADAAIAALAQPGEDAMGEPPYSPLATKLDFLADHINSWLEWHSADRTRHEMATEDGTHIMSLPVPMWPTHGQFKRWIETLREGAKVAQDGDTREQAGYARAVGEVVAYLRNAADCFHPDTERMILRLAGRLESGEWKA